MARKIAAIVFSLGCVQASSSMALGLGELTLDSFLNEPLKARVDLLNTGGLHEDQIRIRLATSDDFKRMGVDRAYFLTSITFEVDIDEGGRGRIVLTSEDPVLEPYLDFIVEARWPSGRLLREYTVLIDPPVFDQSTPVISASQRVSEVEGIPEPEKKKMEVGASSGTRVDVKKSELGPGEMPQRDFNAATSPDPMAGNRYMIHRDDTLWEIAVNAKPAGASVHQTMLDIQRLNPTAFIDGNINRIKAGYIIYLPTEGEISSADLAGALAEVREQNEAWLAGKAREPGYSSGPSLRISAEPDEADVADEESGAAGSAASDVVAAEDLARVELERAEMEQRLLSMEQQVETLQRIVSLKDDQIAALQSALGEGSEAIESGMLEDGEVVTEIVESEVIEDDVSEPATEPAESAAVPAPAPVEQSGGGLGYLWYILGAAVLGALGYFFMRRRAEEEEELYETVAAPALAAEAVETPVDTFADVELEPQALEVEAEVEPEAEVPEDELEDQRDRDNRGYGQRKHDQYASDVEANDALAEADIYIAYGRYPQAIDLLNNALNSEPDNPEYRLKLMELHMQSGDRAAAEQQFVELQAVDDTGVLIRAREILDGSAEKVPPVASEPAISERASFDIDDGDHLGNAVADQFESAPPEIMADPEAPIEADFDELEIEEVGAQIAAATDVVGDPDDELDLSADFEDGELSKDSLDEELVIAAESNGMSTKLDLARAYLDMGDDDGARQILEEVAAEGNNELRAEALALLERID